MLYFGSKNYLPDWCGAQHEGLSINTVDSYIGQGYYPHQTLSLLGEAVHQGD